MGKKKGARKKGSQAGDEDSSSIASASTLSSIAELGYDEGSAIEDDPFELAIDALYEKRATTRERGLHKLVTLFAGSFAYEEVVVRKDTLSTLMLSCIKKGTVVEAALACRGIALLLVTLGAGEEAESLQEDAHPVFEQAACYGKAVAVKAAAIEALAVTAFTASNDPSVVDKCMSGFANLWKTGPSKVATAAIRGWSLLLTTVPAWRMTTHSVEQALQSLAKQLHSEDVEVRAAAGEAIALLYHSCGMSDLDSFLDTDQSDEFPPASPPQQYQHLQSPTRLRSSSSTSQSAQHQDASLDSVAPQNQGPDPPGGAADAATHSSSTATESSCSHQGTCQAHPCNGAQSAFSHSAESESHLQARQLPQESAELRSAELSNSDAHVTTHCGHPKHDQAALQIRAQQSGHEPQHTQQHINDMSHQGNADQQHSQAGAIEQNGHVGHGQASSAQPPRNQDTAAEGVSSSQEEEMAKGGQRVSHKASSQNPQQKSRNPQQKAEAITNGLDDVVGRMRELATNRGDKSRRSKRDRVSMKSTFRELCNVVEQDGAVAPTKIKLRHGDTLIVDTLAGTVQLNALRRFLAEGFQIHLQQNPLLHQIFNFQPREERAERLTPLEKKLYRSPVSAESKSRTQRRNHDRATNSAYKGAMIAEDW